MCASWVVFVYGFSTPYFLNPRFMSLYVLSRCFCKYQACDFSFKITFCADEILTLVADTLDGIPSVTPLYQTHSRSVSTSITSILFIVNMITTQYALNTSLQPKLHELREHTITTIIYISLMDHDFQV